MSAIAILDTPTETGITPIHVAVEGGQIEVLKLFHHWKVKLDTPANNGETPAFVAAIHGNTKIIRLFKKWDLEINTPAAGEITPVHMAAGNGHEAFLRLFHEWGIKLDMPAINGGTPAFFAAESGHVNILKLFHSWGLSLETPTKYNSTPMFIAAQQGHIEVVKYLVGINCNVNVPVILPREALLESLIDEGVKTEKISKRMEEKIAERLKAGDSVVAIKLTPIDIAWVMGRDDIVALLKGVDHSAQSRGRLLPLPRQPHSPLFFENQAIPDRVQDTQNAGQMKKM